MRILTVPQMRAAEQLSEKHGVSLSLLMDNAGSALAYEAVRECRRLDVSQPVILVGKGNNGGDGIVAAKILSKMRCHPSVILCCGEPSTDLAKDRLDEYEQKNIVLRYAEENRKIIRSAKIIIDCIFGTGFKGSISEEYTSLFEDIAESGAYVIACDVPSGVNAVSGEVSDLAVKANMTVSMHAAKLGMLLSPARYNCGEIRVCEIGIPDAVEADDPSLSKKITLSDPKSLPDIFPKRIPWSNKGDFGKLVCVCGSDRYIGAAAMCCEAAMRTGVGLVELVSTDKCINALSSSLYEVIFSSAPSKDGSLSPDCLYLINDRLKKASALLIGCGLGCSEETSKVVYDLIENSEVPMIIDADGINCLSLNIDILLKKRSPIVLTPHPGELARLCGVSVADILSDREKYASDLAKKYGVTVVSKAAETLITDADSVTVIRTGNTALSKAGSGDMLAGALASFAAQTPDNLTDACILASSVIGLAAEALSDGRSERGIIARDILSHLPETLLFAETKRR